MSTPSIPSRRSGLDSAQLRCRASPRREPECGRGFVISVLRSRAPAKQSRNYSFVPAPRKFLHGSPRSRTGNPNLRGASTALHGNDCGCCCCGGTMVMTAAEAAAEAAALGLGDGANIAGQSLPVLGAGGRGRGRGRGGGQRQEAGR